MSYSRSVVRCGVALALLCLSSLRAATEPAAASACSM
jgi:hypothetical protein